MALWSTSLTPFAGGTAVAPSVAQTVTPPSQAASMAFTKHSTLQEAPAVGESSCTIGSFSGSSFISTPSENVSNIANARLEATAAPGSYPAIWWEHNVATPIVNFNFTTENVDSNAGNTEETLDIIWSDGFNGDSIFREFTRETISTTTAAATNLSISDGLEVRDQTMVYVPLGTQAADEELTGTITASSTGFSPSNSTSQTYVTHGIEATSGSVWTDINYSNISLAITTQTAIVTSAIAVTSAANVPGSWFMGLGYTKRRL